MKFILLFLYIFLVHLLQQLGEQGHIGLPNMGLSNLAPSTRRNKNFKPMRNLHVGIFINIYLL